jgi:hypothetical protein
MEETKPRYKKYWIGKCVDTGATTNLVIGQAYLLKDVTGRQDHFDVSKHISNTNSLIGSYRGTYFDIIEDVTTAIQNLPYDSTVFKYDMWVSIVKMVSSERGISIEEAQDRLIKKGDLEKPVVDKEGNPLKKQATIYESGIDLQEDALPPEMNADKATEIVKRPTIVTAKNIAEHFPEWIPVKEPTFEEHKKNYTLPSNEPKQPEKPEKLGADKPKTATKTAITKDKPKLVQKGLFG